MKNGGTGVSTGSEQERAAWAERVEGYAREAAAKNRPFAEALVDMVSPRSGDRVLDVATGPGIVAVEAARRVGSRGSVLATDFIPDWEPYVTEAAREAGVTNVAFAVMPAEALDLTDQTLDVVLCQFGLMFVPDPMRSLREMRRVLRRGGKLGIAVWSVPEKVGLFLVPRIIGAALPPPVGNPPPSPMSMGAPGLVEGLVEEAGYRDVVVERQTRWHEIADPADEWRRWSEDTASPTARGLAALPKNKQQKLKTEAIAALEAYRDGEVIRIPSAAILVTATR